MIKKSGHDYNENRWPLKRVFDITKPEQAEEEQKNRSSSAFNFMLIQGGHFSPLLYSLPSTTEMYLVTAQQPLIYQNCKIYEIIDGKNNPKK